MVTARRIWWRDLEMEDEMADKTWVITDVDGRNSRTVTLAQFRSDLNARAAMAKPISDAWKRGDMAGVAAAQKAMRKAFPR